MNGVFLSLNSLSDSRVWGSKPCYKTSGQINLPIPSVERWGSTRHDIDNQDGNITQRTATRPQVREGLVSGCIDDEETRNLVFLRSILKAADF